jgi:subtilisin family serine protease
LSFFVIDFADFPVHFCNMKNPNHLPIQCVSPGFWLAAVLIVFSAGLSAQEPSRWLVGIGEKSEIVLPHGWTRVATYPTGPEKRIEVWESTLAGPPAGLMLHPAVLFCEADAPIGAVFTPNDPEFAQQWPLSNRGQLSGFSGYDLGITQAWERTTGSQNVVVSVFDSGIDFTHPDLAENIWQNLAEDADGDGRTLEFINGQWRLDPGDLNGIDGDGNGYVDDLIGWDFVNNDNNPMDDHLFGHGTHVSGIIGAKGNNGTGISGIAWNVRLQPLKILNAQGSGRVSDAIAALSYALATGTPVSNHSWGGPFQSSALELAFQQAGTQNHVLVTAAGNNFGLNIDRTGFFPASYAFDHQICVAAHDSRGRLTAFSNTGQQSVDLAAPGEGIYSTLPNNSYGYLSGTSMAAPHVTGAMALIFSAHPGYTATEAIRLLSRSVVQDTSLVGKTLLGGRLFLGNTLGTAGSVRTAMAAGQRTPLFAASNQGVYLAGGSPGWLSVFLQPDDHQVFTFPSGQQPTDAAAIPGGFLVTGNRAGGWFVAEMDLTGQSVSTKSVNSAQTSVQKIAAFGNGAQVGGVKNDSLFWSLLDANLNPSRAWVCHWPNDSLRVTALADRGAKHIYLAGNWYFQGKTAGFVAIGDTAGANPVVLLYEFPSEPVHFDALAVQGEHLVIATRTGQGTERPGLLEIGEDGTPLSHSEAAGTFPGLKTTRLNPAEPGFLWMIGTDTEAQILRADLESPEDEFPAGVLNGQFVDMAGGNTTVLAVGKAGSDILFHQLSPGTIDGCNASEGAVILDEHESPAVQLADLTTRQVNWQASSFNLPVPIPESADFTCRTDTCNLEAYFEVNPRLPCEEQDLFLFNTSQGNGQLQWFIDGSPFSTQQNPVYGLDDDEDEITIGLEITQGVCRSYFEITLEVQPSIQPDIIDTTVCGSRVVIKSNVEASRYSWQDANGMEIGSGPEIAITQSGNYLLEVEDFCENVKNDQFQVTLTPGCVWPGDVNTDGLVNSEDLLALALVNGQTGPVRPNATTQYIGQQGPVWPASFPLANALAPGVNLAHADADGNGVIDAVADGAVIRQNATKTGFLPPVLAPGQPTLTIRTQQTSLLAGDTLRFDVGLETPSGAPLPQFHGLAATLDFSLPINRPVVVNTQGSVLFNPGPASGTALSIAGRNGTNYELAITRSNQLDAVRAGRVGGGGIGIFIDDIGAYGALSDEVFLSFQTRSALVVQANGQLLPINTLSAQASPGVRVSTPRCGIDLTVLLQGAFDAQTGRMRNDLRRQNLVPLISPYPDARDTALSLSPLDVDWVWVEMAIPLTGTVIASRAGILTQSGKVVDARTRGPLLFPVRSGTYEISIHHRNHLRFSFQQSLVSGGVQAIDLSQKTGNAGSRADDGTRYLLRAGDIDQSDRVILVANENDRRFIFLRVAANPTGEVQGYFPEDVNLDGKVDFFGPGSDEVFFQSLFPVENPVEIYYQD